MPKASSLLLSVILTSASSSSVKPPIGECITATSGMSTVGLSITERIFSITDTSHASKYPLFDSIYEGIPCSSNAFLNTSSHPEFVLSKITISLNFSSGSSRISSSILFPIAWASFSFLPSGSSISMSSGVMSKEGSSYPAPVTSSASLSYSTLPRSLPIIFLKM